MHCRLKKGFARSLVLAILVFVSVTQLSASDEEIAFDEAEADVGMASPVFSSREDCRAMAMGNAGLCRGSDCRGVLYGALGYCRSSDCRAMVLHTAGQCQTSDCRAYVYGNAGFCQSENCRAVLWKNFGLCR